MLTLFLLVLRQMFDATNFASFIYISSATTVLVCGLAVSLMGPTVFLGAFLFLMLFPLQAIIARVRYVVMVSRGGVWSLHRVVPDSVPVELDQTTGRLRRRAIKETDHRVRLMNEILTCVKLIKMYAWEDSFSKEIQSARGREHHILRAANFLQSVTVSITPVLPGWLPWLLLGFWSPPLL